jgi:hypothetical protein
MSNVFTSITHEINFHSRFENNCICFFHSCHQNVDVSLCNHDICNFVDIITTDPTHVKKDARKLWFRKIQQILLQDNTRFVPQYQINTQHYQNSMTRATISGVKQMHIINHNFPTCKRDRMLQVKVGYSILERDFLYIRADFLF